MKKGITLAVLVASIVIMFTIITTTVVYATSSIKTANYEKFKTEIDNVRDLVNAYYLEYNELPVTGEIISPNSISKEFELDVISKNDNDSNLLIVDLSLLKNLNIKIGNGNIKNKNVFVISDKSHNIYYLKGYKYKGNIIF